MSQNKDNRRVRLGLAYMRQSAKHAERSDYDGAAHFTQRLERLLYPQLFGARSHITFKYPGWIK